jgi:hypothetical protein
LGRGDQLHFLPREGWHSLSMAEADRQVIGCDN